MDFTKFKTKEEALKLIFDNWKFLRRTENVPLEKAYERVLAENQYSQVSLPVVRASGMDGVAVNYEVGLENCEAWTCGEEYERADTGDDFNDKYDTVIPIEMVYFLENGGLKINLKNGFKKGDCVMPSGCWIKKGDLLMKAGFKISALDLGELRKGGIEEVPVIVKPKVGFIPTGSELISGGEILTRGHMIDTNSIMAKTLLDEMGACVICHKIVKDDKKALEIALNEMLKSSDIVIINGGSSKGGEDFNTKLLEAKGKLLFHEVRAVPGRPMGAAIIENKLVVNLAGPSVATYYGLNWCIKKIISSFLGTSEVEGRTVIGRLTDAVVSPPMVRFVKCFAYETEIGWMVQPDNAGRGKKGTLKYINGWFETSLERDLPKDAEIKVRLFREK